MPIRKPLEQFSKDSRKRLGYSFICRLCKNIEVKNRKKNTVPILNLTHKTCSNCKKELPVSAFYPLRKSVSGYRHSCKECSKADGRTRTANAKIKKHMPNVDENKINEKICVKCNSIKPIDQFRTNIRSIDGHYNTCNDCWLKKRFTKELRRASERKYLANNPHKVKEKAERHKVQMNQNSRIRSALKNCDGKKDKHTIEYLGCSISYLKKWLESLFTEGMNWSNCGKWHIDHVTPCASFDLTKKEDIDKCFNWRNLQPLWAKDNIAKGDKIITDMIDKHKEKVLEYEKHNPSQT